MEAQTLKPHVITRMILAQFTSDCTTSDAIKELQAVTNLSNKELRKRISNLRQDGFLYQPGRDTVYHITKAGLKVLEVV